MNNEEILLGAEDARKSVRDYQAEQIAKLKAQLAPMRPTDAKAALFQYQKNKIDNLKSSTASIQEKTAEILSRAPSFFSEHKWTIAIGALAVGGFIYWRKRK